MLLKTIVAFFLLNAALQAQADAPPPAPTYSLTVSSGSFSPNPLVVDDTQPSPGTVTATASVSGSVGVTNPNNEYQKNNDDQWYYSPTVSGFSSTKNGSYVSPSGITLPSLSGSSSGTITATANQTTTPGYYQIMVTASDHFTVVDSATSPSTTIPENPPPATSTLYLTVAAVNISPHEGSFSIGAGVNLSASVQPSDLLPSPAPSGTFQWTVPNTVVAGYTATDNPNDPTRAYSVGVAIPLSSLNGLQSASVHFYWVDTGNKRVALSISGLQCNPSVSFNVTGPTFGQTSISPVPSTVAVDKKYALGNQGVISLHAGEPPPNGNSGMAWTFTLPPSYPNTWEWIQLIDDNTRSRTEANGSSYKYIGVNYPALDDFLPYQGTFGMQSGYSGGDSPGTAVHPWGYNGTTINDINYATLKFSAEDWLMYEVNPSVHTTR